jgi:hypothetical protein
MAQVGTCTMYITTFVNLFFEFNVLNTLIQIFFVRKKGAIILEDGLYMPSTEYTRYGNHC